MNVLNVMSLLIELLGNQMKPFLGTLLQLLPALWDASQEHNLLRCAIISTLVHVVKVIIFHKNYLHFKIVINNSRESEAILKICYIACYLLWPTVLTRSNLPIYIYWTML